MASFPLIDSTGECADCEILVTPTGKIFIKEEHIEAWKDGAWHPIWWRGETDEATIRHRFLVRETTRARLSNEILEAFLPPPILVPKTTSNEIDYRARLCDFLGLDSGASSDDEICDAVAQAMGHVPLELPSDPTSLFTLSGLYDTACDRDDFDQVTCDMEGIVALIRHNPEYQAERRAFESIIAAKAFLDRSLKERATCLFEKQSSDRSKREGEVDAIIEQYGSVLTTPESRARIRGLLLSDRESGMDILRILSAERVEPAAS